MRNRQSTVRLFPPQSKQKVLAAHEERASGDSRRGQARIAELVDGEQLELWAGLYHRNLSLLGREVQLEYDLAGYAAGDNRVVRRN
jgi:hypothetical protein